MNKKITWKELKALDDIYHLKKTKAVIQGHPYISYLLNDKGILDLKRDNIKVIISAKGFEEFYEREFKMQYDEAKFFLESNGIEANAKNSFTLEEVKTLMLIEENKAELKSKPTNIEDFSNEFFDISKYLKNKIGLRNAVFKILDITQFPLDKKENQWRIVVDRQNPDAVIICENKSFLKQPWIAKNTNVKLWYVGGNNIKVLDDIDEFELPKPFYYCCDWDLAGLEIYERIKRKLKLRNKDIILLYPNLPHKKISTYIAYHDSHWNLNKKLSGLQIENFNKKELLLIQDLIKNEQWIEEESFDLITMLRSQLEGR
ncbi:hypothetical protein [Flavobacterium aquicola]|uniref:Uncharacterized protein DUF2220 n=1 Tax=Flavobacterium aquicola TaxID=1682742 RepID=A0A3E0EU88_9FLAO|nr:hypothetical protein [Flavobacterium aquicola]REH00980.1 uncharacterized protein DUF2220 [Flavobacterium aquicola]